MWLNIIIGSLLLIITILIHSFATKLAIQLDSRFHKKSRLKYRIPAFGVARIVLLMFFAAIVESIVWAYAYILSGAIEGFEDALYFSIVTLTTLGYGDITLNESWRLLASFEAATGIIVFGWSTAIVMAVVQNTYFRKTNR